MATLTSKTPVRLQDEVCEEFVKAYGDMIEEHGANYAVNFIVAAHLRRRGHSIGPIETPSEKIAAAQSRRWENVREANEAKAKKKKRAPAKEKTISVKEILTDDERALKRTRSRELKRKRDERYRAKKKEQKALRDFLGKQHSEEN